MKTLQDALKRSNLRTMIDFKEFVTSTLVRLAQDDHNHSTRHAAQFAEEKLRDNPFLKSKMYSTACLFGIIDSIMPIAAISPETVGSIAFHIEMRTRHHPRLRNLFVEKTAPLLEKLPSVSIVAAHGLAHNLVESCVSMDCIQKIAPAALAIVGFMDDFVPYQAGRFIHDFDVKLRKLVQTGHGHNIGKTVLLIVTEGQAAFDKLKANDVRYHVGNGLVSLCEKYVALVPELAERAQQLKEKIPSGLLPSEPATPIPFTAGTLFTKKTNG